MSKAYRIKIFFRVLFQFVVLTVTAFIVVKGWYLYLFFLVPLIVFQLFDVFRFHLKTQQEIKQFSESVHYRDFSRHYSIQKSPSELRSLREGFNEINLTFREISRERETQFVYLQKILELVDTGILSYKIESGEVVWINEAFKDMLGIPYLKNIVSLEKRAPDVYENCMSVKAGERKLIALQKKSGKEKVMITSAHFLTGEEHFKLVAFQNVSEALDQTEAEAWQKLLSVMTHEIMNSIAPISSLASTLQQRLKDKANQQRLSMEDLALGIETIRRRSDSLLKFAETYRNLNKIGRLNLGKVYVRDLFENLYQLMEPTLQKQKIHLDIVLKEPRLSVEVDVNLMEQVLINLVLNAVEALSETKEPKIVLSAMSKDHRTIIRVADNGRGIAPEIIDRIFVPFFSTRKNGSGIGLSLCKQIMLLHKGNIQVISKPDEGTAFVLSL